MLLKLPASKNPTHIVESRFGSLNHALIAESRFGLVNHALIAESRFGPEGTIGVAGRRRAMGGDAGGP